MSEWRTNRRTQKKFPRSTVSRDFAAIKTGDEDYQLVGLAPRKKVTGSAQDIERGPGSLSWYQAVSNEGVPSGRRWILYNDAGEQAVEEITIDDNVGKEGKFIIISVDYEHEFGGPEGYANTLEEAQRKVHNLIRKYQTGLYDHDPVWAGQEE